METTITYAGILIAGVVLLAVFFFVAKRVLRLALRLMFVGIFICVLLAAGAWGWWNGWFGFSTTPRTERATPARRSH